MIPSNPLQKLRDLDRTSPHFHNQLIDFLRGNEYRYVAPSVQGEDLAWLVDCLDSVLCDISDSTSVPFQEPLDELSRICGIKNVLPKACTLSDSLLGCVYEGTFNGSKVRIRRVRAHSKRDQQRVNETFRQVTVVWKHITHPNIVPLLGVTTNPPQLISDWMPGGDLTEYVTSHPDTDRISLLSGVAEGLSHLHSRGVIHGELKGSNILVDADGHARITDFGLAVVTQNLDSVWSGSDGCGDSGRWIAPEILSSRGTCSKEADVFSFAMVTIEVFTSAVPFSDKSTRAAISAIISGDRPSRPTHSGLTDKLWTLVRQCWDQDVDRRPNALRILCSLCSDITVWKRLTDRPLTIDERVSLVADLCSDRGKIDAVKDLSGGYAQSFIDMIDEVLDGMVPSVRRKCLAVLCKICSHHALIPRSIQIPLCYDRTEAPRYRGGFAEVWKGEYEGMEVAVKVLKVFVTSDLGQITKRFCREVMTWKALRHQNVLPLFGVTMSDNQFAMVSEWMADGNINEFVKTHRDANRFQLLEDVARGLIYMHSQSMIHGDLKGANIMIDKDGGARLADFGLLTIVSDSTHPVTTTSSSVAGTMRWMSPELLDPERFGSKNGLPTRESDCYALGMVILEVLTGQIPFPCCNNLVVMRKIVEGEQPERPQGPEAVWFTDDLWGMLERCWLPKPELRPTVEGVLECLERGSATWEPLSPSTNGDSQADSDDELFYTMSHHPYADQGSSQPSSDIQHQPGEPAQPEHPSSSIPRPSDSQSAGLLLLEDERTAMSELSRFRENRKTDCRADPPLTALATLSLSKNTDLQRTAALACTEIVENQVSSWSSSPLSLDPIIRFFNPADNVLNPIPYLLNPIIHLLDSHDTGVQQAAYAVLGNIISRCRSNDKSPIIRRGGLEAVIRHMSSPNIDVQCNAVRCIRGLIEDARMAEPDALIPLVQLACSKDQRVQDHAVFVLLEMISRRSYNRELVDAGVIPVLARLLDSSNTKMQYKGICALLHIADDDGHLKELMRSIPGLVQTLCRLMDSSICHFPAYASDLLRSLARNEKLRLEITNANNLNTILHLLQSSTNNPSLYPALHLFQTLVTMNGSSIIEAGFLQPLINLLASGMYVSQIAANVLSSFAAGTEKNKLDIFDAGAVQAIKELVMEVPKEAQIEMIACIRNLSDSDELKGRMLEMGISRVLIRLMNSPNREVRCASCAALRNVIKGRKINFRQALRIQLALAGY